MVTDEDLIERMANIVAEVFSSWKTKTFLPIASCREMARAILPLIREAELRGVKAGLEAAVSVVESGMFNSRGQAQPVLAAKLRAIDPATVEIE